jgi:hypothetical protein
LSVTLMLLPTVRLRALRIGWASGWCLQVTLLLWAGCKASCLPPLVAHRPQAVTSWAQQVREASSWA